MSVYNKIVVAIDLSSDSQKVIDTALKVAGGDAGKMHLVHVVEPIAAAYSMDAYAININELQQEALSIAAENLGKIAAQSGISEDHQHTLLGAPSIEIRNLAEELGADAIVIGSHGHSGWKILLGSTANKVLHGACCDVLTVLVGKQAD
ncbi:MAG: universal stress protein [Gammaproteobacteria bacterium]|nr:universal stress protein [Pseudomonadales bacterium]MCP5345422.1 universal stress protein [Pseudomonadales bacterium]